MPDNAVQHVGEVTGARLLASDIRITSLLVNDARYRTVQALFGVRRDQVNLVTLIAAMALAEAAHKKTEQLLAAGPTRSNAILGLGLVSALGNGIAGPTSPQTPLFGLLVGSALLGGVGVRALRRSAHGVKACAHHIRLSFRGRYGRPPHPTSSR